MLLTNVEETSRMTLYRICAFLIKKGYTIDMDIFAVQINGEWRAIAAEQIIKEVVDCIFHDANPLLPSRPIDDVLYNHYEWILDGDIGAISELACQHASLVERLHVESNPMIRYQIEQEMFKVTNHRILLHQEREITKRDVFHELFCVCISPVIEELTSLTLPILSAVDNPYGYYDINLNRGDLYVEFLGDMRIRDFNLRNGLPEWNDAKVTACRQV